MEPEHKPGLDLGFRCSTRWINYCAKHTSEHPIPYLLKDASFFCRFEVTRGFVYHEILDLLHFLLFPLVSSLAFSSPFHSTALSFIAPPPRNVQFLFSAKVAPLLMLSLRHAQLLTAFVSLLRNNWVMLRFLHWSV